MQQEHKKHNNKQNRPDAKCTDPRGTATAKYCISVLSGATYVVLPCVSPLEALAGGENAVGTRAAGVNAGVPICAGCRMDPIVACSLGGRNIFEVRYEFLCTQSMNRNHGPLMMGRTLGL